MSGRDSRSTILPQEGIEFKPPSDASRDGGTPHAVRVTMFSEFTGGYVKVRQGHEEATSHNTRADSRTFGGRNSVLLMCCSCVSNHYLFLYVTINSGRH